MVKQKQINPFEVSSEFMLYLYCIFFSGIITLYFGLEGFLLFTGVYIVGNLFLSILGLFLYYKKMRGKN
jgi:hypothetical protein